MAKDASRPGTRTIGPFRILIAMYQCLVHYCQRHDRNMTSTIRWALQLLLEADEYNVEMALWRGMTLPPLPD